MCRSQADGGQRCFAHARKDANRAVAALRRAQDEAWAAPEGRKRDAALLRAEQARAELVEAYAHVVATPEGWRRWQQRVADGSVEGLDADGIALATARGQALRDRARAVRDAARAPERAAPCDDGLRVPAPRPADHAPVPLGGKRGAVGCSCGAEPPMDGKDSRGWSFYDGHRAQVDA